MALYVQKSKQLEQISFPFPHCFLLDLQGLPFTRKGEPGSTFGLVFSRCCGRFVLVGLNAGSMLVPLLN